MVLSVLTFATAWFAFFNVVQAGRLHEYATLDYDYAFDEDADASRGIIMMIPDGTGPNVFTLAHTVLDPTLKARLHIDPLLMGQVQSYSSTSFMTDSAAAATAYSTGFKAYDKAIAMDHYGFPIGTTHEAAKAQGMLTGMIVTCRVTHATPASFAAHVAERNNENEIARQYVANKNLDFVLGGGLRHFTDPMLANLTASGYSIVRNYAQLLDYKARNQANGTLRDFGLFHQTDTNYELDRAQDAALNANNKEREPSLPEMVSTILSFVKSNPAAKTKGFFIIIEGSRIDHAGHVNDAGTMAQETIAFDKAVGLVKNFVNTTKNVGLISAADHGTGGMTLGRDNIYNWRPTEFTKQKAFVEWMKSKLQVVLDGRCGSNELCKTKLLAMSQQLIQTNSNVTTLSDTGLAGLNREITKAVDITRSLSDVTVEMARIISRGAVIVGTNVDLHCMGPTVLERMCKGLHENTYINKVMASYLNLEHQQSIETLRLRNFTTLL